MWHLILLFTKDKTFFSKGWKKYWKNLFLLKERRGPKEFQFWTVLGQMNIEMPTHCGYQWFQAYLNMLVSGQCATRQTEVIYVFYRTELRKNNVRSWISFPNSFPFLFWICRGCGVSLSRSDLELVASLRKMWPDIADLAEKVRTFLWNNAVDRGMHSCSDACPSGGFYLPSPMQHSLFCSLDPPPPSPFHHTWRGLSYVCCSQALHVPLISLFIHLHIFCLLNSCFSGILSTLPRITHNFVEWSSRVVEARHVCPYHNYNTKLSMEISTCTLCMLWEGWLESVLPSIVLFSHLFFLPRLT